MTTNPTTPPLKILINIEQFGFGPVASIADFFPFLQNRFTQVAYVGNTPPQASFNFNAVLDENEFEKKVTDFDLFFTASHFGMAEIANSKGVPTAIYDSLCWYRPQVPEVLRQDVLYMAQGFYGVKERIMSEKEKFSFPVIVKPVPLKTSLHHQDKNLVLLNLGGIQNPYWSIEICQAYAEAMIFSFKKAISPKERFIILCDPSIAKRIPEAKSLQREEMTALLGCVKFVVQTPALGNIFDAAINRIPSVLLPPTSDFQGQQLQLLLKHRQTDGSIDWEDISPGLRVDYKENQKEVLGGISRNIIKLCATYYREKLENIFRKALDTIAGKKGSHTTFLEQFESRGIDEAAAQLAAFASIRSIPK